MVDDLVERLLASDQASALTNEAARRIEFLERKVATLERYYFIMYDAVMQPARHK